jgi:hypothetical protein
VLGKGYFVLDVSEKGENLKDWSQMKKVEEIQGK